MEILIVIEMELGVRGWASPVCGPTSLMGDRKFVCANAGRRALITPIPGCSRGRKVGYCDPPPGLLPASSARGLLVFIWSFPGNLEGACAPPPVWWLPRRRAGLSLGWTCCGSRGRGVLTGCDAPAKGGKM